VLGTQADVSRQIGGRQAPSRRWCGEWALPVTPTRPVLDVLIPTLDRPAELAVTLAGLAAQDDPPFAVTISDQSDDETSLRAPAVQAMVRVLQAQGRQVTFLEDRRPHHQASFEPWEGPVTPEQVRADTPAIERASLHGAANLTHVAEQVAVPRDGWLPYKIAWIGACTLFRRAALVEVGGFDFWEKLPQVHAGEDVAAQWRVMERYGAAGILPSGAVHLEAPTTVPDRTVEARDILFPTAS
jgi:hypothetical protein